jgi:hypothetical protein
MSSMFSVITCPAREVDFPERSHMRNHTHDQPLSRVRIALSKSARPLFP